MFPPASPTSGLGQLEGEISRVRQEIHSKAESYTVSALSSRVDDLAHQIREFSADIAGLRDWLQRLETQIEERRESVG